MESGADGGSSPENRVPTMGFSGHNLYNQQPSQTNQPPPMSRTHQYRKVMKPLLERKRRARINKCLDELKDIMVTALQAEGESISKLEKADVLELTVKHLQKLKQQNALGLTPQSTYVGKFRAGYAHCAQEVSKFMTQSPGVDNQVSTRLLSHLGGCIQAMDVVPPSAFDVSSPVLLPQTLTTMMPPKIQDDGHSSFDEDEAGYQALDLSSKNNVEDAARRRQLSRDSDSGNSSLGHEDNSCNNNNNNDYKKENRNEGNNNHLRPPLDGSDKSWRPW